MQQSTKEMDSKIFSKAVSIHASAAQVWQALTQPEWMKKWMISEDMEIHIDTDWKIGNAITIRGNMNGKDFENSGVVMAFEPGKNLCYSHLSSISKLPDQPSSHSIIAFRLESIEDQTTLSVTVSNFPTESIYKHLAFYWNVALEVLKRRVENQATV